MWIIVFNLLATKTSCSPVSTSCQLTAEEIYSELHSTCTWNKPIYDRVRLLEVDCSQRGLKTVPASFPDCTSYLDLSSNNIDDVKETTFNNKHLGRIRFLNISNNGITTMSNESFRELIYLETIDLSHNNIPFLSYIPFLQLYKLERLDLNKNDGLECDKFAIEIKKFHSNNILVSCSEKPTLNTDMVSKVVSVSTKEDATTAGRISKETMNSQKVSRYKTTPQSKVASPPLHELSTVSDDGEDRERKYITTSTSAPDSNVRQECPNYDKQFMILTVMGAFIIFFVIADIIIHVNWCKIYRLLDREHPNNKCQPNDLLSENENECQPLKGKI